MSVKKTDFIRLNVGGTILVTTRATLTSCPGSMLSAMFGGEHWDESALPRDESGAFMLDSDARYFAPLLNFLRRGDAQLSTLGPDSSGVLAEAQFYGITPLVERLGGGARSEVSWSDVGGLESVKRELRTVVGQCERHSDLFRSCGVSPSRNLLLYGPPGCGKTMLARATASELKASFVLIKCPELLGGGGQRKIQEKFALARALQPCVVFLEEFEAVAKTSIFATSAQSGNGASSNGADNGALTDGGANVSGDGGSEASHCGSCCCSCEGKKDGGRNKTDTALIVNQMAMSLDEILSAEKVFVFAATNRPDLIDPTLLRPGRFDQLIYVPLPNDSERVEIIGMALKKAPLHKSVSLREIAGITEGLSGADLFEVCKRACKFAIRESIANETTSSFIVSIEHFERALKYAKPSVSEEDLYRYEHFNRVLKQISNPVLKPKK